MRDEFSKLAGSNALHAAAAEPDFLKKAIGLFQLRETIWSAFSDTKKEIEDDFARKGLAAAKKPGRIGFVVGALLFGTGAAFLFSGGLSLIGICVLGGIGGLFGGCMGRGVTRGVVKGVHEDDAKVQVEEMRGRRTTLLESVEAEITKLDNDLLTQPPVVRDEFRAAFHHAALKQAIREHGTGTKAGLTSIMNLGASPSSAPPPAPAPEPDVTLQDDVTTMKRLKLRGQTLALAA